MKNPNNQTLFYILLFVASGIFSQESDSLKVSKLFKTDEVLQLRMNYSNRAVKSDTNDSTYLETDIIYFTEKENRWDTIGTKIRARGNFRLQNCYFAPLKMKIKKKDAKGTLFKGNKKLKVVLPCLQEKAANDNIVKEFMAYKIYEHISPFHFKTRLFKAEIAEQRGKKEKKHQVVGFFIEDLDEIIERFSCNEMQRNVHPLQQEGLCSTRNAFFQFMIGNTDFSTGFQHNEKLIFVNKNTVPIPYDFDMSGLVNASYSVVSDIGGAKLPITDVRDRMYRGFKRNDGVLELVRREFIDKQDAIMATVNSLKPHFENESAFESAKDYIEGYFAILINERRFQDNIVAAARIK